MKVARFNSLDDAATVRPQLRAATLDLLAPVDEALLWPLPHAEPVTCAAALLVMTQ